MGDVEWGEHTNEEIVRSIANAPRIFGPWEAWEASTYGAGYGWSRREVHPGPSWRSGGSVAVQRHTGIPGYGVSWWDGSGERRASNFQTPQEAMAYGDAWLVGAGCRLDTSGHKSESTGEKT
jgi:hypothetical protein